MGDHHSVVRFLEGGSQQWAKEWWKLSNFTKLEFIRQDFPNPEVLNDHLRGRRKGKSSVEYPIFA